MRLRSVLLAATVLAAPMAANARADQRLSISAPAPASTTSRIRISTRSGLSRPLPDRRVGSRPAGSSAYDGGFVGLGEHRLGLRQRSARRDRRQLPPEHEFATRQARRSRPARAGQPDIRRRWSTSSMTSTSADPVVPLCRRRRGLCLDDPAELPERRRSTIRISRAATIPRATSPIRRSSAPRSRSRRFPASPSRPNTASSAFWAMRTIKGSIITTPRVTGTAASFTPGTFKVKNRVQPRRAVRHPLRLQRGPAAAAAGPVVGPGPGAGPLLSRVLRLGQGDAHRSRAPDHPRGGGELDPGAVHPHRGERLHRHVRHAAATTSACRSGARRRSRPSWSKDGVPRNAITIQGFGETHLLVPTGPGVREPQNRRVEIIIH